MAPKQRKKHAKSTETPVPTELANPFEEKWARSRNAALKRQARQASTHSSTNKFVDKRIGEHDPAVSDTDRYLLRLQRERSNRHKRAARFNLEDHDDYGDADGEDGSDNYNGLDLEDPITGQYRPDNPDDHLDDVDVEDGDELFTRKKPHLSDGGADDEHDGSEQEEDRPKSKQEVMHDLIQKSKFYKEEKKQEKHHITVETLRLDTGLQDIMELLNKAESDFDAASKKSLFDRPPPPAAPKDDDKAFQYEAAYNLLAQEKRARPTQRLLTDEERAERERERLIELERLRKQRMSSLDDSAPVDEMDDERDTEHIGADDITDSFALADDIDSDLNGGDEGVDDTNGEKFSDIRTDLNTLEQSPYSATTFWETYSEEQVSACVEEVGEIPFVFEKCPATVSDLAELFKNTTISQRTDILDRLQKCFAISLDPGRNRTKLQRLTECLLFWVERLCEVSEELLPNAVKEMDALLPHIHALGTPFEQVVSTWAGSKITESAANLKDATTPLSSSWTVSDVLVFRCISRLFPSSDLRHGVMTPLALLLSEALSSARIYRLVDVAHGVFVAYVLMDVLGARKGFSPELIQFICDVLGALSNDADELGEGKHLRDIFRHMDSTVPKEGPLSLADCVRIRKNTIGKQKRSELERKVLDVVVAMAEVIFEGWVPHPDIALAQVDVSRIRPEWVRKRIEAILNAREKERTPLSLYTKRERVVVKTVNPRMSSSETGVFHKRGRTIPGIAPMKEAAASAKRVRKALRKEVRKLARDVRSEADVAAGHAFAEETVRRQKANAKDQKIRAFFEHQRSTWRAAEKQQKKLSRKRW